VAGKGDGSGRAPEAAAAAPLDSVVRGLDRRLRRFLEAALQAERLDAFFALVRWTRRGWASAREDVEGDGGRWTAAERTRMRVLLDRLEADPLLRARFQDAAGALLEASDGTTMFAEAGIPSERGLLGELGDRVLNRLLPRPRDDRDLASLLRRLFRSHADVRRFERMPERYLERLLRLMLPGDRPQVWAGLRRSFADAFRLLATSVQAQGLSSKLRARSRATGVASSPFYRAARAGEALAERWMAGERLESEAERWRKECGRCRDEMREVHRRLEADGVNSDLIYGLEVLERSLARMETMVVIMSARSPAEAAAATRRFLLRLVVASHEDRSVRHLLSWSTRLLLRRIVERSGEVGEHYITRTRAEYRGLWLAAAGGGLLTVGTAAIKMTVSELPVSDFAHGFLYGLNYALSFLLLQRLGLVLATKQPAMTAASLATIIRERRGEARVEEIIECAARICRSQIAAAMGNVLVVALGATLLVHGWSLVLGRAFLRQEVASAVFQELSPLDSGTVFYAALTGVILWLASMVGGWFDNFCAYHRLPQAIAEHPLGKRLGRRRMGRWGKDLARHAGSWGTSVSLGFMLGMTPAIGHFLGLPLDVRHVTLSTGTLSLASASLGHDWFGGGWLLRGVAGVAVMFGLNLSVSFLLALMNAARAYELPASDITALLRTLYRRFVTTPRDFLLPPSRDPARLAPE